jgi:CelD/BcsL family acetyltransferase involved in cellulose biosynthesis
MKVSRVRADALTSEELECWSLLQRTNPNLASPFFCPEYTQAVAAAQAGVSVGILRENDRIVGFFPFQRAGWPIAHAIGVPLTDYHGFITEPDLCYDVRAVMRGCGLAIWDFDYVPRSQTPFESYQRIELESPVLDLSRGYEAYLSSKYHSDSEVAGLMRKSRKLAREVGPLRFVAHLPDVDVLRLLMCWKNDQYLRTGVPDLFSLAWVRSVIEKTFALQTCAFAGMLSVLYAGDHIVAMHYGIRSSRIWHWWFPVYDPRYAAYSPGLILLLKMAEIAESLGLTAIDFGHTRRVTYKDRFMNGSIPLWGGSIELPTLYAVARRIRKQYLRPAVAALRQLKAAVGHRVASY